MTQPLRDFDSPVDLNKQAGEDRVRHPLRPLREPLPFCRSTTLEASQLCRTGRRWKRQSQVGTTHLLVRSASHQRLRPRLEQQALAARHGVALNLFTQTLLVALADVRASVLDVGLRMAQLA